MRLSEDTHGAAGARRASGGRVSPIAHLGHVGRSRASAEDHVGPKARLAGAGAAGVRLCTFPGFGHASKIRFEANSSV